MLWWPFSVDDIKLNVSFLLNQVFSDICFTNSHVFVTPWLLEDVAVILNK